MIIALDHPHICQSCYADELEAYLHMRSLKLARSTYLNERNWILSFDRYISSKTDTRIPLTNEFLNEWLSRRPNEKTNTQSKRLNTTKQLFRFLCKCNVCIEEIQLELRHTQSDYVPYIFSDEEIRRIFKATDHYRQNNRSPFLHLTVAISFRVIYGCGLRSSELVKLKKSDVDMEAGIIYIHDAKFNKARYVPFTSSLSKYMEKYMNERFAAHSPDDYFIAKTENRPYTTNEVHYWFMKVLYSAGIRHNGKGYGPRVHDLRHTFAVHSLRKCILEGREISAMLPILSAYLGHKDLRGTQNYLRLTSDLYPYITSTLEQAYGQLLGGETDEK